MTNRFLIHIGYPKSGSSSLQQNVLMQHSGVRYLAGKSLATWLKDDPEALSRAQAFYQSLIHDQTVDRDALAQTWSEVFLPLCRPDKLNIVSDERFVMNYRPPAEIAADLRYIVGEARILLVARDQVALMRSQYDMNPFYERDPDRKYMDFGPWITQMLDRADENMTSSLRYRDMVALYAGHFGEENVIVSAFEYLFSDEACQVAFAEALGLDANEIVDLLAAPAMGDGQTHGYKKFTRRILGGQPVQTYLTPAQIRFFQKILRRLFPGRKTEVAAANAAAINSYFAGQTVADIRAAGGVTVIPGKA